MPAMFSKTQPVVQERVEFKGPSWHLISSGDGLGLRSLTLLSISSPWCWWLNVKTWQPDPCRAAACTLLHNTWTPFFSPLPYWFQPHILTSPEPMPVVKRKLQPPANDLLRLVIVFVVQALGVRFPRVRAVASRGRSPQPTEGCSLWAWQANCQGRSSSLYKASASAWKEKKKSPQAPADTQSISHDGLNASLLNGCLNSAGFQSCSVTHMSSVERAAFTVRDRSSQIPGV